MVHQLAMLLLATVSLSVLCVAVGALLSLRGGFSEVLLERESRLLNRFAIHVAERAAREGGLSAVAGSFDLMHQLVEEFRAREGDASEPQLPSQASRLRQPGFEGHIRLVGPDGSRLAGNPAEATGRTLSQDIVVAGRAIGKAQFELDGNGSGLEADVLRRQYQGVLLAALAALALSMGLALHVARRWGEPLVHLGAVTRKLAAGRFEPMELSFDGPQEIAQLSQDVSAMADSLRRLELTRRKWMAQISHELRTPLSVLQGEIESVEDGAREPNLVLVMSLGEEVRHMVRIVDDLHLLAVADLGSLPCHAVDLDPLDTLDYIAARLVRHPSLDGLEVDVVPPEPFAVRASWDPVRIEQVLRNLLSNSARYTDRPGRVRLTWAPIDHKRQLQISIEDSAPGVDGADLPHVFEPLFRADRSRQRSKVATTTPGTGSGGSGLGLAIVRAIVLAHHGSVDACPSALGGLAIRIVLPITAEEQGVAA